MGPPRLRLFGVIHVDRVSKVTAELDAFADGVDALFIEQPEEGVTARTLVRCLLRVPAFFFGWALLVVFLTPPYALLHRAMAEAEKIAVRRVADRRDLPVHAIDDHPLVVMSRSGPRWWVANWAALAVVAALDAVAAAVTALALVVGVTALVAVHRWRRRAWLFLAVPLSWGLLVALWWADSLSAALALASALVYLATVVTTLGSRNDHMLERVGTIAEREGYDESCLVTGRAHLSGLVDAAPDTGVAVTRVKPPKWLRRSDREWSVEEDDEAESADDQSEPTDATVGQRLLAASVDLVALAFLTVVGALVLALVGGLTLGSAGLEIGIYLGLLGIPLSYFPLGEWRYGRTVGKRLVGLTVRREGGAPCTLWAALVRHFFRPFEIVLLGLGFVSMVLSGRSQRLGDRPAGTVVVRAADGADTRPAKDLSGDRPSSQP